MGSDNNFTPEEIKYRLSQMGIDVLEPESRWEQTTAQLFEEFSNFVLHQEPQKCLEILQRGIDGGDSVGELQGGNDDYSIYRVSFPLEEYSERCDGNGMAKSTHRKKSNNAALALLNEFNDHHPRQAPLTTQRISQYMLNMCHRRSHFTTNSESVSSRNRKYNKLGNLMLIMQFGGPTEGQVRHIDNMVPNVQICCYMSCDCPSTIVYQMEGDDDEFDEGNGFEPSFVSVMDCQSLLKCWEAGTWSNQSPQEAGKVAVPAALKYILQTCNSTPLKSKWYTRYFAFWHTLDSHLRCFGKLYQPVKYQLGLKEVDPGTTLLAGGNEVHAGPPTKGSRMFAFAIGIPDAEDGLEEEDLAMHVGRGEGGDVYDKEELEDGENDGEVQYSPVLLHIDLCCLLFGILDYDTSVKEARGNDPESLAPEGMKNAKKFLLNILIALIRDYPMKGYLYQIPEERVGVRKWLERVLDVIDLQDNNSTIKLVEDAVESDVIFYSPDVVKRNSKKKRRRPRVKKNES